MPPPDGGANDLSPTMDLAPTTDLTAPNDLGPSGDFGSSADLTGFMTIHFSGHVSDSGGAIAGVTVCVYNHPELPCTTSDASGAFTIALPETAKTGVLFDAPTHGSVLIAVETGVNDFSSEVITMEPTTELQAYFAAAGTPYPNPGDGFLWVRATASGSCCEPGATFSLSPASGVGPFYADATGLENATLVATTTYGLARFGALAPAASLEVDVQCPPGKFTQTSYFGWPVSGAPAKVDLPIVAGYETHVGFDCF
jgi:hypothetical protein